MFQFDTTWDSATKTLFLDRDGVINILIKGDYIKTWEEFNFIPGTVDALVRLRPYFKRMVIATNQRGIAKQLMTAEDLHDIHRQMVAEIEAAGGKLDNIYYCPNQPDDDPEDCRKPRIGMARQAQADFPEIDFAQSIMIGDSLSDMEFGRNAGMHTVFVCADGPPSDRAHLIDHHCPSLVHFADWLIEHINQ